MARSVFALVGMVGALMLSGCATLQSDESGSVAAVSPAATTVQCSERGLCRVTLTPAHSSAVQQKGWRSVRFAENDVLAEVQWLDFDEDGRADQAFFTLPSEYNPVHKPVRVSFTTAPAEWAEPAVQFVLSQRVDGQWRGGALRGGRYVDVSVLEVPTWHGPGTRFLRYEGPAWEMRDVGYRLYLDERNGTDIFGKQVSDLVLHEHGRDGDDYHTLKPWGADILKVGESLGIGAPGRMIGGRARRIKAEAGIAARIIDNGPHIARMLVRSDGWDPNGLGQPVDIETHYAISADSRLTHITAKANRAIGDWVTGIVKHPGTQLLKSDDKQPWQYLASFGRQSLFDDHLGMAIFYRLGDAQPAGHDEDSYLVGFIGSVGAVDYLMGAWWEGDPSEVSDINQFKNLLEAERAHLAQVMPSSKK